MKRRPNVHELIAASVFIGALAIAAAILTARHKTTGQETAQPVIVKEKTVIDKHNDSTDTAKRRKKPNIVPKQKIRKTTKDARKKESPPATTGNDDHYKSDPNAEFEEWVEKTRAEARQALSED